MGADFTIKLLSLAMAQHERYQNILICLSFYIFLYNLWLIAE